MALSANLRLGLIPWSSEGIREGAEQRAAVMKIDCAGAGCAGGTV